MNATTRKQIAQDEGYKAARNGQGADACPYPESTAAKPDKHNLHFNWMLGHDRGRREMDYPRCLGVGKRFCDATPTEGTPYCEACRARLDGHFAVAAGCAPLHDPDASTISETVLANGNVLLRHGRMTIFCGSAHVLGDLRAYLAQPLIEAAAERADDAIEALAELRAA